MRRSYSLWISTLTNQRPSSGDGLALPDYAFDALDIQPRDTLRNDEIGERVPSEFTNFTLEIRLPVRLEHVFGADRQYGLL